MGGKNVTLPLIPLKYIYNLKSPIQNLRGDPNSVTINAIFGESSGGAHVEFHILSPQMQSENRHSYHFTSAPEGTH